MTRPDHPNSRFVFAILHSFQNPSIKEEVAFSETLPGSQREGTGQRGIEFNRIELQKLFDIGEFQPKALAIPFL